MRWVVGSLAVLVLSGCATTGQPMSAYEQQQAAQALSMLLGGVGTVMQAQQAQQQQKQVHQYNEAIIEQQKAGARILNAIADQAQR